MIPPPAPPPPSRPTDTLMGKPTGFKEITRETPTRRPVELRVMDWDEIYLPFPEEKLRKQGARCMDCGIPFCNNGCPLGNQIPDWNDLVYRGRWREALASLEKTNNFPEFTGRICPAPCEEACVLTINDKPVTIKLIEQAIADKGWDEGWIVPRPPRIKTGKTVAVVGSGPAGMAAAQQLCRAGHDVTVFERDDRPGGLLIYGIPDFKMDKRTVDRRVRQMEAEGVTFKCNAGIGTDVPTAQLQADFDAVLLCLGATQARDVQVPGRDLDGIHLAMTYLPQPTKANLGDEIFHEQMIDAAGKDVIIIGGGDTAADCLGSALRQGAKSVKQFDINRRPPEPGEVERGGVAELPDGHAHQRRPRGGRVDPRGAAQLRSHHQEVQRQPTERSRRSTASASRATRTSRASGT